MKLFKRRRKGNNKGFSLIELVCAVAILGIVLTAIGGAMVVSAQSYAKGTYEIDVQQEAQTTTNLIGNLIVDAVTASFSGDENQKILTVNNGKLECKITFDTGLGVLNYEEKDLNTNAVASGVLAQNVIDFDVNLSDFQAHNNAEVYLKVEKENRVYEATYNTTSRNGSSESTGVADVANIIVENNVVLEPGQTYSFPITVVGSASNKAISVSDLSAVTGDLADTTYAFNATEGVETVTIGVNATGTFAFNIATIMTDENGLPLASEQVVINVRRVNEIVSPSDVDDDGYADASTIQSGIACKSGAVYRIDFTPVGENFEKVFGKAFDMDYIDPRQVNYSITMNNGYNVDDYVNVLSKIYTASNSSNAYVLLQLKQDLPNGAEISVTATSNHAAGANKASRFYATVSKTVSIKKFYSPFTASTINRGNDDHGVVFIDSDYHSQLNGLYGDHFKKYLTVYEAEYDETGALVKIDDVPEFTAETTQQGGDACAIRKADSMRLLPDKAYIIKFSIIYYNDSQCTSVKWPLETTDPSLYSIEFPVPALSIVYMPQPNPNSGVPGMEYGLTKNDEYKIDVKVVGLDLTRYQNNVKWSVEKADGFGNWETYTNTNFDLSCQSKGDGPGQGIDGFGTMNIRLREEGTYKLKAKLVDFEYIEYKDNTNTIKKYNCDLHDGSTVGVFYVKVR